MKVFTCIIISIFISLQMGCSALKPADSSSIPKNTKEKTDFEQQIKYNVTEISNLKTLQDFLNYAEKNNPKLEAMYNDWQAELQTIPQMTALPDPMLSYSISQKKENTIGISQNFPWFGKLNLSGKMAFESAKMMEQKYLSEKLELFYNVKKNYYEYYYLLRAIGIMKENISLLKDIEKTALAEYTVSQSEYTDVIKIQIEIAKLEDQLRSMEEMKGPIKGRLLAELNLKTDVDLKFPEVIEHKEKNLSLDELSTTLKENNPLLKEIESEKQKDKYAIALAKKNYYPDVMLGLEYMKSFDQDTSMSEPEDDSSDKPLTAMVSINLPIHFSKYRAQEKEMVLRYNSAVQSQLGKENNLISDLKTALFMYKDSNRKIKLYRDVLIPKMKQNISVAQNSLSTGKIILMEIIDNQRMLLEFQDGYERAVADNFQALAEIEMIIGKEIKWEDRHEK